MRSSLLSVVSAGKHIITTNKGPIAHQYDDLQRIRGPGERKTINRVQVTRACRILCLFGVGITVGVTGCQREEAVSAWVL